MPPLAWPAPSLLATASAAGLLLSSRPQVRILLGAQVNPIFRCYVQLLEASLGANPSRKPLWMAPIYGVGRRQAPISTTARSIEPGNCPLFLLTVRNEAWARAGAQSRHYGRRCLMLPDRWV